jgi:hypothetical protein
MDTSPLVRAIRIYHSIRTGDILTAEEKQRRADAYFDVMEAVPRDMSDVEALCDFGLSFGGDAARVFDKIKNACRDLVVDHDDEDGDER